MEKSKKELAVIAVVVVAVVAVLVLALAGSSTQVVDKSDAEKTLGDLGYEGATVESCNYIEGTNVFDVPLCQISGTFTYEGVEHTYEFNYTMSGEPTLAEVDGKSIDMDSFGDLIYNYTVVKEMTSFTYTTSYGSYTDTAADGMKYVVVNMVAKNISSDFTVSPTTGGVSCITDANQSYDYSSSTHNYTGKYSSSFPNLAVGGEYHFTLLFQIPEDATVSSISYGYIDLYGWKLDTTLAV